MSRLAYDEESDVDGLCGWKGAILGSAALLYLGSLVGWVLLYIHFGGDCPRLPEIARDCPWPCSTPPPPAPLAHARRSSGGARP